MLTNHWQLDMTTVLPQMRVKCAGMKRQTASESVFIWCVVVNRYKDYRNPDGEYTKYYYELLVVRLAFVVVFEVLLFMCL